jgi:hypothetical protein
MRTRSSTGNAHFARLIRRFNLVPFVLSTATFFVFPHGSLAQDTLPDGDYSAVFKGKIHYVDRQPAEQQLVEQATIRASSSGGTLTIDVGQLGSAMSATRFTGTSGNANFVAIHSVPGRENQAKVIWGQILNHGIVRGTLLYPRVAEGLVPGFTELQFEARPENGLAESHTGPTPRDRGTRNSSSPALSSSSALDRRPSLTPSLPSASSEPASEKKKKELKPRQPPSGSSVIRGTITGDTSVILNVQLVDENENTLQTTTLDRNGRYRFDNVGAARYWIYVNDGRAEAYITTTRGDRSVDADGRSSYRIDFNVRN